MPRCNAPLPPFPAWCRPHGLCCAAAECLCCNPARPVAATNALHAGAGRGPRVMTLRARRNSRGMPATRHACVILLHGRCSAFAWLGFPAEHGMRQMWEVAVQQVQSARLSAPAIHPTPPHAVRTATVRTVLHSQHPQQEVAARSSLHRSQLPLCLVAQPWPLSARPAAWRCWCWRHAS